MESMVGKMGLTRLLEPESIKVKKSDVAAMVRFDKAIKPTLSTFLNMDKPDKYKLPKSQIEIKDFDSIMEDLDSEISMNILIERGVPGLSLEQTESFMLAYGNVLNSLQKAKPLTQSLGVLGLEDSEPADEEKTEFIWMCRLVNDIDWIFTLMNTGQLIQAEVELFEALYPDTYNNIMLELITLLTEKSADKVNKVSSQWQLDIIAALMKVPSVSVEILASLQSTYLPTEEEQAPQKSSGGPEVNVSNGLTESQKLEEA